MIKTAADIPMEAAVDIPIASGVEGSYTAIMFQLQMLKDFNKRINLHSMWNSAKRELIKSIKDKIDKDKEYEYMIVSEMPCGEMFKIKTFDEIMSLPIKDIPCPCGNPYHYFIKFNLIVH